MQLAPIEKEISLHLLMAIQYNPYKEDSTNIIYNLLFCDNLDLFKVNTEPPHGYPWDILFAEASSIADLQKIIDDAFSEPRLKILAYNKQLAGGYKPGYKELLAVIIEVGLDNGLDVLASFKNGTVRYINQTGKMIIWETADQTTNRLTTDLFAKCQQIVSQIGAWSKPRKQPPTMGNMRITFLVSDGLYFGEGPVNVLFEDPLASSALTTATELVKYITETSIDTTHKEVSPGSKIDIQGEYDFRRTEIAAGFNFSGYGKFQFFFSYGAVDRNATGSFTTLGNTLKLKSDKEAGKDFTIIKQSKQGSGYTLTFKHPNKYLLKNIIAIFMADGKEQREYSDDNGKINIDLFHCDTVYVQHSLYPDIATLVKDKNNNNNKFELKLNPSLEQVSFKGIDLNIVDDKTLTCLSNYFMPMPDIKFIKQ